MKGSRLGGSDIIRAKVCGRLRGGCYMHIVLGWWGFVEAEGFMELAGTKQEHFLRAWQHTSSDSMHPCFRHESQRGLALFYPKLW